MATSKKEIEDEWDAKVLYSLKKDVLALMAMMGEHTDYENDWIIDSGCSNYMIGNQEKILQDSNNIEEILQQKMERANYTHLVKKKSKWH